MAFNEDATLLASASNTETIHIFKLDSAAAVAGSGGSMPTAHRYVDCRCELHPRMYEQY
jgi:hypothetical protein